MCMIVKNCNEFLALKGGGWMGRRWGGVGGGGGKKTPKQKKKQNKQKWANEGQVPGNS